MLLDTGLRERLYERLQGFPVVHADLGEHRHAAVVLAVAEEGGGARVAGLAEPAGAWSRDAALILTRRSAALSKHAGQWALPGGRVDVGESIEEAALRELREEVGLVLAPDAILGRLDDFTTRSGYVISPVVAWAGEAAQLTPNEAEVASIHRIRLTEFMRIDSPELQPSEDPGRPLLRMRVGKSWIAAPTAAVIYQFREVCLQGRHTRVAHYEQPMFARR